MTDREAPGRVHRSKVARVIDAYGLDGLGDRLARAWHGDGTPRRSLRELADDCNRELLAAAVADSSVGTLQGEVDNLYRLLTDEGVSTAARTEAETKLERAGVDVESLHRDFVSHQAVHTYLTKYRDVEAPSDDDDPDAAVEKRAEAIGRLQSRLVAVTERSLESLRRAGHLSLGSFDVVASLTVYCNECDRTHDLVDVLASRGCDCQRAPE